MLNHQRRLTLPRPTAAPTATQLRVVLTLRLLLLQREEQEAQEALGIYACAYTALRIGVAAGAVALHSVVDPLDSKADKAPDKARRASQQIRALIPQVSTRILGRRTAPYLPSPYASSRPAWLTPRS